MEPSGASLLKGDPYSRVRLRTLRAQGHQVWDGTKRAWALMPLSLTCARLLQWKMPYAQILSCFVMGPASGASLLVPVRSTVRKRPWSSWGLVPSVAWSPLAVGMEGPYSRRMATGSLPSVHGSVGVLKEGRC